MRSLTKIAALVTLLASAFIGGYVVRASKRSAPAGRHILYYVDPMHPAYHSDKPGVAPDCGMRLVPVYADEPAASAGADAAGDQLSHGAAPHPGHAAEEPMTPAGGPGVGSFRPGAFRISPARQQLIGVTFAPVELDAQSRSIRAVGKVSADETRVVHVHTRFDGWIEKVFVNFTGDFVRQGTPLLTIYSPEMLASQQELLLAARARDLMRANPLPSAAQHGDSLFEAARQRLQLWQLGDAEIQQVLDTGRPLRSVTLYAPQAGFVTERNAFPNQKVTADSDLYTITDLGHVWIMADVFESDIAAIKVGERAYVTFPTPGMPPLAAKVTYIQPEVDPATRTLKVRLDAANRGFRMKPEMFVNVEFGVLSAPQLVVPAGAVLDTGERQTVFVDLGDGYLQPRRVVTGDRFDDRVAILGGLSAGERVVSSGTFLIDSESQLHAAAGAHRHD